MTSMTPTQPTRHDATSVSSRFLEDVLRGLSTPRKSLPSKYFYHAEGSRLFEAIANCADREEPDESEHRSTEQGGRP
jgi:uncharacterized SAM-dependent methyltransferase